MFDQKATKKLVAELHKRDQYIEESEFVHVVAAVIQDPQYANADFNHPHVKSFTDAAIDTAQCIAKSGEAIKKHYAKFNRKNKTYSFCVF
jgi:hypothetical protein